MTTERRNDLRAFKGFIDEQLANVEASLSLDEALLRWECENATEEEQAATVQAIQRGLDDLNAGRIVDAFEFTARMRRNLQAFAKP